MLGDIRTRREAKWRGGALLTCAWGSGLAKKPLRVSMFRRPVLYQAACRGLSVKVWLSCFGGRWNRDGLKMGRMLRDGQWWMD